MGGEAGRFRLGRNFWGAALPLGARGLCFGKPVQLGVLPASLVLALAGPPRRCYKKLVQGLKMDVGSG